MQLDKTLNLAIQDVATAICDAAKLKGEEHFNKALTIEGELKRFAQALLAAAQESKETTSKSQSS